jgi:hypothetical protein
MDPRIRDGLQLLWPHPTGPGVREARRCRRARRRTSIVLGAAIVGLVLVLALVPHPPL